MVNVSSFWGLRVDEMMVSTKPLVEAKVKVFDGLRMNE